MRKTYEDALLFVDDEVKVLDALERGLKDEAYECIFVASGKDAIRVLESREISVIVTDMRMPEMNGLQLLKEVNRVSPRTVKIVLSGYTQLQQVLATINAVDIFKFITKPWELEQDMIPILRQAVKYYRMHMESARLEQALESKNQAYQRILADVSVRTEIQKRRGDLLATLGREMLLYTQTEDVSEDMASVVALQPEIFSYLGRASGRYPQPIQPDALLHSFHERLQVEVSGQLAGLVQTTISGDLLLAMLEAVMQLYRLASPESDITLNASYSDEVLFITLSAKLLPQRSKQLLSLMHYIRGTLGKAAPSVGWTCLVEAKEDKVNTTLGVLMHMPKR